LGLIAAAGGSEEAAATHRRRYFLGKAGFSHARLADQHDESSLACGHRIDRGQNATHLFLASNQGSSRQRAKKPSNREHGVCWGRGSDIRVRWVLARRFCQRRTISVGQLQGIGQLPDGIRPRRPVYAPLEVADGTSTQAGSLGQFLLGKACVDSEPPEQEPKG
jgi:hypothetical protein